MRFRLEASPEELTYKGTALLEALAKSLEQAAPDLAEVLCKAALAHDMPELRFPVLKDIHAQTRAAYVAHMQEMVEAIGRVLDRSHVTPLQKADDPEARAFARAKEVLLEKGLATPADFGPLGRFGNVSVRELLDLALAGRR